MWLLISFGNPPAQLYAIPTYKQAPSRRDLLEISDLKFYIVRCFLAMNGGSNAGVFNLGTSNDSSLERPCVRVPPRPTRRQVIHGRAFSLSTLAVRIYFFDHKNSPPDACGSRRTPIHQTQPLSTVSEHRTWLFFTTAFFRPQKCLIFSDLQYVSISLHIRNICQSERKSGF